MTTPTPDRPTNADALDVVRKALTFADWAAGEGLHASDSAIPDPSSFMHVFYETGEETPDQMIKAVLSCLSPTPAEASEPKRTAEAVCHEEQMTVWADEFVEHVVDWLSFEDYDDKIAMFSHIKNGLRHVVESALSHPEASEPTPAKAEPGEAVAFPRPQRKDGKEPCGECHLRPGETCDICGAYAHPSADLDRLREENETWRSHAATLLANLDYLTEATGEGPEDEDRVMVEHIRSELAARAARTEGGDTNG